MMWLTTMPESDVESSPRSITTDPPNGVVQDLAESDDRVREQFSSEHDQAGFWKPLRRWINLIRIWFFDTDNWISFNLSCKFRTKNTITGLKNFFKYLFFCVKLPWFTRCSKKNKFIDICGFVIWIWRHLVNNSKINFKALVTQIILLSQYDEKGIFSYEKSLLSKISQYFHIVLK
jgi:hypothetical protein